MEAESSRPADGERSGRQEQQHATGESSLGSCPPQQPQQPPNPRPVHRALGRLQNRQPRRSDLLLRLQQQQAVAWQHSDTAGPSGGSFFSSASPSTSSLPSTSSTRGEHGQSSHSSQEGLEGVSSPRKGEKKPQKPGKYVCNFCGRPCAKPSVLQKHIRSHTGERPYPCAPCGFSFKTKSNLYKHRKSHAHRIKAGLASSRDEPSLSGAEGSGVGEDPGEHTEGESTESEEETGQHRKSSAKEMLGQQKKGGKERLEGSEESQKPEDSQAVKQRLALRLSERKRGPMTSPDDPPSSLSTSSSSLGPGSKGSTESGYFSGSGSTDLSQVSPPSSSAKTYAEIILGKCGRLGGQQRSPHQQQPHSSHSSSSGTEEKGIPFAVPKTQVIEHITKLITINEAVVDTSEIDSVKPRRSSLSRKSSMESPKFSAPKDPYAFDPKMETAGSSSLRHLQNPETDPQGTQDPSAVPLLRSHSMPTSTTPGESFTSGTMSPRGGHRLCQSFDEQQAVVAEMRVGHAQRMLRRQPAIEVPLGAELMLEEASPTSPSTRGTEPTRQPQQQQEPQKSPSVFECGTCGTRFQHRDGYETHRRICPVQESGDASKTCREDRPLMMHYKFRALAMAVRKRRKEESLEEDPPSPGSVATSGSSAGLIPVPSRPEQALSGVTLQTEPNQQQQQDRKGVSVIQHTSSFEKQETMESQEPDLRQIQQTQQPEPKPSPSTSRLIRQPNIQVPEILVTVEPDADMPSVSPPVIASSSKEAERVEEFQWPQRSQTLAQLPAEKLPPKKKRLRLAEAAQSSGESSFESLSLPRSPSQESNISSFSASFEDTARSDPAARASSSQSSQMLMVPSASYQPHQSHKEMRRSASEQTPASPQQTEQIPETRSKSFDYGSLSPQQSSSSWKERRKCLLVKHATLGEPEQEVGGSLSHLSREESPKPGPSHSNHPDFYSSGGSSQFSQETTGKALQPSPPQTFPPSSQDLLPFQPRGQQAFPLGSLSQLLPVTTAISEAFSTQIIHRAFLHSHTRSPPLQIHPGQIHIAERLGLPLRHLPPLVPLQISSRTRASQGLYLPVTPRVSTHVLSPPSTESRPPMSSMASVLTHPSLITVSYQQPRPLIATCLAQLTPVVSLVVPVRLQTHIPTYASAMYTTLSQILASTHSQEPPCCTAMVIMRQVEQDRLRRTYLKVPSPDIKRLLPLSLPEELASGSGEGFGSLGAGGSKRMLSPAASLELSTEAQRHQKRVKEEGDQRTTGEEEEEEDAELKVRQEEEGKGTWKKLEEREKEQPESVEVTSMKVEGVQDQVSRKSNRQEREDEEEQQREVKESSDKTKKEDVPGVLGGVERQSTPSFPSLHTSTSVNWCYRNYVKPNPSAQSDPRTSVYSTWSVSSHNPNLPGLSTKVALSLLCSKQKHSSETYTMATAPVPSKGNLAPATSRTPSVSEVHATSPSTLAEVKDQQQQHEKEENKEPREEEGPSTSKQSEPSRVRIFEGGYKSNEDYVYVRGRGRGKYICGECGIRCKKPSMLKKHIRTHTDVRPYICKHCNFAFKTKGNLTKHMKSKAHGKKCQAMGVSESSLDEPESEETGGSEERVCGSEEQEEHRFSDVGESDDDDDNDDDDDDDEEEESASHDDPPSSCSSDTHPSTGGRSSCSKHSRQGTPDREAPGPSHSPGQEPSPRGVWPGRRAASPGSRRALFSRRGWKASPRGFSPSSESCSPSRSLSPRLELSPPIHGLSPRAELSSPSRHVSPSPERGPSPIRPVSPLRVISPSCYRSAQVRTPPSPVGVQHRAPGYLPWESPSTKGSHVRPEKGGTAGGRPTPSQSSLFPPAFRLSTCEGYPGHQTAENIFSHLPMHSQQAKVPYLMIPIGGIQMVQARPRSHPATPSSPTSPPLEGPSLARFESHWGGTPRTQGLRTPGDHWPEQQAAGTSQSGRRGLSTALTFSKPESETTDSKQYGSSHSSVHGHRSATETTEHCARDSPSRAPLSLAVPVAPRVSGQQPEREAPPPGGGPVEGGAEGDSERTDQST
ncbi:transcription factor HIVEP3 [Mugil cephalus]|uniref:transcription factor HIVEP3 n=1 Tax=Mugil cephalus TaxID=48193 RepID=UPI001FB58527|nr:transcription factor HIVEP3 [Mugil cephalus]XP_047454548.1 transcription factor HIVEP3 [Mugil cephalus]XP_047454549.1 transcription factor HIVEP3 [Mugil cephalus]XP_047454550.1 transcription factor HIVEP3 [Mugil cephalus]XP_047454551.1 transcription factor HIVEP3 [Mugil cephalus]XP_047454552.1 transcription factor HIVEP3 [Mugil cephalus]